MNTCAACRWFNADYAPDDNLEDSLGLCEWPAKRLPYSLRYGARERMAVRPIDGTTCPCWEPRGGAPAD